MVISDLKATYQGGSASKNPGFQQTRALIRLMRVITSRLWDSGRANEQSLIHPYDIDLNDSEPRAEIEGINSKLANAVAHDIAGARMFSASLHAAGHGLR